MAGRPRRPTDLACLAVRPAQISRRRASLGVVAMTAGVQVLSFFSSVALARVLGATDDTDAYFLALSIQVTMYSILLAAGRLGAIPHLTRLGREQGSDFSAVASELVTTITIITAALVVVATALAVGLIPILLQGSSHLIHRAQL